MVSIVGAQATVSHTRIHIARMLDSKSWSCVGRYSGSCLVTHMIVMFVWGRKTPEIQQFADYVTYVNSDLSKKLILLINIICHMVFVLLTHRLFNILFYVFHMKRTVRSNISNMYHDITKIDEM